MQTSYPQINVPEVAPHFLDERYIRPEQPKPVATSVIQQPIIHHQQPQMPNGGGVQRVRAQTIQLPRNIPPNTLTVGGQYLLQTSGPLPPGSQLIRAVGGTQYFTMKQPLHTIVPRPAGISISFILTFWMTFHI